jgi:hypothetical protein
MMSRYIYEHLYLASLYFDDLSHRHFFRLVRSRTPPGKPIDFISTRRPYDDPGVERVYYRLDPIQISLHSKTHMPYQLSRARRARWTELFLDAPYDVRSLPGSINRTSPPTRHRLSGPARVHALPLSAR